MNLNQITDFQGAQKPYIYVLSINLLYFKSLIS